MGIVPSGIDIGPHQIALDDRIIIGGDVTAHGIAVLSTREGLTFSSHVRAIQLRSTLLYKPCWMHGISVHCLRDLTRGGLASALNEIAASVTISLMIDESIKDPGPGRSTWCVRDLGVGTTVRRE